MERYVCIHGHFYQPPRENPWLESVEVQDTAYPYHDWNERITAECYAPNAASRILDERGQIQRIVNNYARISYNFGPTLLSWMEAKAPDTYRAVLDADRESRDLFSGHGSAMAQAYGHLIMPLANRRDKITQVRWGLRDFERRYRRPPEAMWLPETAVDLETLDVMAEHGIAFTVLAPSQAARFRPLGGGGWQDVAGATIDPTRPYLQRLPSGRTITLFFYDGPVSRAVAFEQLLSSGDALVERLMSLFQDGRDWPQLVHIATDGETYGHHHRFGEMALAYALHAIEASGRAKLINYGEYLERHPPAYEVEIFENSSWSCVHGVERWRSDCGCGAGPGWSTSWRAPLREALDWLRDQLIPLYEQHAGALLRDPWAARDAYIDVVLDRSRDNVSRFLGERAKRDLTEDERVRALKLLELQRQALLMFTSCGWFFDELSRIEPVQVLMYAGRALQLAEELFGAAPEEGFLQRLAGAKSNLPAQGDGKQIFERFVRPARVDLPQVVGHYAMITLFRADAAAAGEGTEQGAARIHAFTMTPEEEQLRRSGRARLGTGRVVAASEITHETLAASYAVLHLGEHTINGGVRPDTGQAAYQAMAEEIGAAFDRADFPEVIRLIDRHFEGRPYSLRMLFRDEQRAILQEILDETLGRIEEDYRRVYERYAPLIAFLKDLGYPQPTPLYAAAELVLNTDLRRAITQGDLERTEALFAEAQSRGVELDEAGLGYALQQTLDRMAGEFLAEADRGEALERLRAAVTLARSLPFFVHLGKVQNIFYDISQRTYPEMQARAAHGDEDAVKWLDVFRDLGERLTVRVE